MRTVVDEIAPDPATDPFGRPGRLCLLVGRLAWEAFDEREGAARRRSYSLHREGSYAELAFNACGDPGGFATVAPRPLAGVILVA